MTVHLPNRCAKRGPCRIAEPTPRRGSTRAPARGAAVLVLAVLALAGGLHAQEPEDRRPHPPLAGRPAPAAHGTSAMPGMPMAPGTMMPLTGGTAPSMLLMHRQPLGLSDAQVDRLTAIAAEQHRATRERMPELMRAHADLLEAMADDVDLAATRAALDRMAEARTSMTMTGLRAQQQAREVLTPDQRRRIDAMTAPMRAMGPMMMHHGMPGMMGAGPMMGPPAMGQPMMGAPMMHGAPMMRPRMRRRMMRERHDAGESDAREPGERRPPGD